MKIFDLEINGNRFSNLITTDSIVEGDILLFTEDVYEKGFFSAKYLGKRHIVCLVEKQFSGNLDVFFRLKVIDCTGCKSDYIIEKEYIRRKEHTIFKYFAYRQLWNDEFKRYYSVDKSFLLKSNALSDVIL